MSPHLGAVGVGPVQQYGRMSSLSLYYQHGARRQILCLKTGRAGTGERLFTLGQSALERCSVVGMSSASPSSSSYTKAMRRGRNIWLTSRCGGRKMVLNTCRPMGVLNCGTTAGSGSVSGTLEETVCGETSMDNDTHLAAARYAKMQFMVLQHSH